MKKKTAKLGIVGGLEAKYAMRLARAQEELKREEHRMRGRGSHISDLLLFWKWAYRVRKGWYGFNLGHIPPVWTEMLDEFLCWMEIQRPDFEIHQIKMKWAGVRIHLGTRTDFVIPDENIRGEISHLENLLRLSPSLLPPTRAARKP
jgi:hypothetical protein